MPATARPSDPAPQFLDALAYTDEGVGAVTLVAIPGLPGSGRDFRWLAPPLHDDFRVIRIDPPGYGASPRSSWRGMSTADRAQGVLDVVQALGLGPIIVVGHSAGGGVVAHLAHHHPQLVSACVMISATGPRAHFASRQLQLLAQPLQLSAVRRPLAPVIRRLYTAQGFPSYLSDDERAFALLDAAAFDFGAHRANLGSMRTPTMVVWAQDDPVIPATAFQALADAVPPGPRLQFVDGGHNPQKSHALEIAAAIRDFVEELAL